RYPRGTGPGVPVEKNMQTLPIGKGQIRREGQGIALLGFGSMVQVALEVADSLDATVVNMRFVKPLDETLLIRMADSHEVFVTLEDNAIAGGAGSAVNEFLLSRQVLIPILNLGLPDRFVEHGSREECLSDAGLDAKAVLSSIKAFLRSRESMNQQKAI
ncbi:MAG: transketolase C-terminal domain-containing protein, partial [Gammaproteobacteria bacterium]